MMRSTYTRMLWLVVVLVTINQQLIHAQNYTLSQCGVDLRKKRQAIFDRDIQRFKTKQASSIPLAQSELQAAVQSWVNCVKGLPIPPFEVSTINGELISANGLKGKIIMINFWFMACPPCILELPALNQLVDDYKDKPVVFIGFSTDQVSSLTGGFLAKNPFHFKIVGDAKTIAKTFGFEGYPTTFVIDQAGSVNQVWMGGPTSEATKMEPYLKAKVAIDSLLTAQKQ